MRCKRNCIPVCAPSIFRLPYIYISCFVQKFFFFFNIVLSCNVTKVSVDKRLETNDPASQRCPMQWQKEMLLREHRWTQLPPVALSSSPFWPSTSKGCGCQLPDEQKVHSDHLCVWISGISLHRNTGGEALLCPETDRSHQGLLFASC